MARGSPSGERSLSTACTITGIASRCRGTVRRSFSECGVPPIPLHPRRLQQPVRSPVAESACGLRRSFFLLAIELEDPWPTGESAGFLPPLAGPADSAENGDIPDPIVVNRGAVL